MSRRLVTTLAVLLTLGFLPVIAVALASWVAGIYGCTLNEAAAHPCVIWGADRGAALYAAFVLGWLALLTVPLALIVSAILLVSALLQLRRGGRG